ncbi:ribonuclease P protein component [Clostridium thermosuccinogenes]|jgi:ribonuclease P protein component|nr:ribonuclease P protein component [Pseudoclostridium thermosuccinogenes]
MTEELLHSMYKTIPIKKNYEFLRIYKKGRFYVGKFIVLYVMDNNLNVRRLGITVGKKFGKSVRRNRVKRLIRENYRVYEPFLNDSCDYVFVARNTGLVPDYSDISKEMKFLFKKLGVFDREKWNCSRNQ